MSDLTTLLTFAYLAAFQLCALPAILRIRRRRSSDDLSLWREVLLLFGVACQFAVMVATHADPRVWISPIATATSVAVLLAHEYYYRK